MDDHYSDSGVHDPETSATGNRNAASRCPQTALAMSLHRVYNQKLDLERGKLKQAQKGGLFVNILPAIEIFSSSNH